MNEKALQDSYNIFKAQGYNKSIEEYKTLLKSNGNALNDSYKLFKSKGYNKSIDDYKVLMGVSSDPVKKKEPTASVSPSGQKPTSSVTPAKKASGQPDYLSPTSDLGPKSPKMEFDYKTKKEAVVGEYKGYPGKEENTYRVYNGNWQRKMPNQTNWQDVLNEGSVNALNKQFNQAVKYSKAQDKYKGVVEDKRELVKKELDTKLSTINSKLIDKSEGDVIPKLQKQFPNFKFAPSGTFTDEVKVIAPNNETIIVKLDNWSSSSDTSEAELLRSFIRVNSNTDKAAAEKELQQAEKQREYFDIKPFNPTIKLGEGYGDEQIVTDLNKIVQPEGAPTDIMTADKELKSARKELMKQSEMAYTDVIDKVRVAAKTTGKVDDKEAAADLAMLKADWKETKAGNDYFNDISTQGTELKQQWTDLQTYVDGVNTKLSTGEITQDQYENEYVPLMKKGLEDLQVRSSELNNEYTTVQNVNNSIVRSSAENMIIQESRGSIAGGVAYGFTKGLTDVLRVATLGNLPKEAQEDLVRAVVGYGTTEEYMNSEERSDITKVLFSLSRTLGQAATGSFIGKGAALAGGSAKVVTTASAIPFFSSGYYEMKDQFDDPKFNNISDAQKVLFSALYGTASAALEKYGLTKSVSKTPFGKNLTNTILASAIKGLPKNASEEAIKEAIESSIVNKIKSAGVSSIGAFVVEGATEATQKATEVALQESFDLLNKGNYFESGTAWNILSDVIYEGYLGGLGGSMMNVASNGARIATDGISKVLNKDQAKVLDIMTQTEGMNESFDTYLKGLVVSGDITPEEAGSMSKGFREVKAGFDKIPSDIPVDQKTKAFDLIVERSKIEKEISGKEDNLVVVQKERIKEINNELQTISKDAVQEQAAGEVSVQPEATTSEEVVQGKPESGPEVVTEEGKKEEIDAKQAEVDSFQAEANKKYEELKEKGFPNNEIWDNPEYRSIRDRQDAAQTKLDALQKSTETAPVTERSVATEANQEQVATLRAQEQVELAEAIPNIDEYKVDGKVAKSTMPADVLAKYEEIYDRYDKLITPLLTTAQESVSNDVVKDAVVTEGVTEADPKTYSQALVDAKAEMGKEGPGLDLQVSDVTEQEAKDIIDEGGKVFMTEDGKAGAYVKKDGYMGGLFKNPKSTLKEVAKLLQDVRIKAGGYFMEAYGTKLEDIYIKNGFRPVARIKFNEEYAPEGWDAEGSPLKDKPDVVFFTYDPTGKYSKGDGEYVADYDTAYEMAKSSKNVAQEVEAIGQLLSGTNQEIDQKASKVVNKKISKAVANAAKAVSKILPGTKFVVHDTNDSFVLATGEGKTEDVGGIFDPKTNTIHINGTKANRRTVAHEVFHAILLNKVKTDANAAAVTKRMVQAISAKIENNPALKKKLDDFIANYEENIQNEEKVAELVGMLAENYNSMSASIKDLLARWIDKLASMFGLDPFDRNETYDMLNTIAKKVAKGKEISEVDVKMFKGGEKVNSPSEGLTSRKQYGNKNVRLEVRYLEQERMDELIKNGLVQEVNNLSALNGQRVVTTSPDDMLVGSIYVNGKEVAVGNGGIFFVTKFGDVWANSNKGVAKGLASAINEASRINGGKAYLVLVKGSDAKLVSSPQGVTSSLAVTESLLDAGLFSLSDFRSAIRTAVKDAGGTIALSQNGSAKTLKNELDSFFSDVTASTFEKRGNVLKAIISNLAKSESASGNKTEIIKFLNGDTSKGLGVGVTAKSQSLVDLVAKVSAEQLTKGLNTGDIYGVIEINGEVDIFEDQHQSYPYHIKMVDKNGKVSSEKPVLILPKNRKNGREILTSVDGLTSGDLGTGFAGKVGATANMPYGKGIIQDGKTESTVRKQLAPEVSRKLTEDKKGNFVFHHYSGARRNEIKPGTGENIITGKEESGALSSVGGLAMYYTMDNQVEPGVGGTLHTVLVPSGRVYDFNQDPDNFYDEAKKRFEAVRPSQSFSPNYQLAFVTQVANENGYDMVVARWRNNELRAQTTIPLKPSSENIRMKPIEEELFKVGDDVEVYGSKGKVVSIDGDVITFKGDGVGGEINFKRFPKNISKQITPRKQITKEVAGIEESMTERKQKVTSINDIVRITKDKGFSDAAIRQYLKDQGFADKQATAAINEYNVKKEGIFIRKDGGIPTKIADSIRSFRRRMFSARSFLPKSVFASRENKDASVARHLNIVDQNVKDFNRLYAKYKGDKDKLVENFDAYIRGDKNVKLPEDFMAVANSMRNQIDGLSMQLINSGLVDADMAQTIKDNLGQYLTRSYKIYDRENWKKEVEDNVKQKAINLLKSQYKEMAQEISDKEGIPLDEVLDNLVTNRLDEMLTTEGAKNFITGSKLGSKDLSVLKERQDIPIEIRMLLGEYSDPALNYAKTVLKLSSLAANHKFLTEVKKTGMGVYFFEKNDPRRPADFNTMIASEGSESMNPLNGMYTTKEIADAFMAQPSQLSDFWKTFMKFQSTVRWLKTIGSVATHIKNVFGNIGFIWINSHFDPKEVGRAFMTVKNDFSKGTNQQRRDKMNNYIALGIVKQSAGLGEVMDMFKDADWDTAMASRLSNQKLGLLGKAKRIFLQGKKKIEDAYQAEDDFFKVVAYENELSRYSKAMFDKNKSELTEEELAEVNKVVTEIVKNTYPTYDRIPEAIKMVRRAPFIGNFVSFQAESYRTAFNTMAIAKNELASDNKKIKAIGAQRLAGATTYLSAKSAILAYFSMAAGTGLTGLAGYLFDDEDEEQRDKDIRKFVAPWSEKSDLLMISVGDGKMKYIDFSSSDPHGGMKKVMNAFFLGETTIDSFSAGIVETFAPFIGEDMTVEALLALKNNQDKYGNPIYNTEESLKDQGEKVLSYMYKLVEPGTFSSIRRGWAAEDKTNELVANLTGFRTYDVPIVQQFGYKMKDYSERITNAKKIYNQAAYNEKATEADKEKAYKKAQESLNGIYSEITDLYNSAERLGCDPKDLGVAMDDFGNMSKRTVRDIKSGELPELKKK